MVETTGVKCRLKTFIRCQRRSCVRKHNYVKKVESSEWTHEFSIWLCCKIKTRKPYFYLKTISVEKYSLFSNRDPRKAPQDKSAGLSWYLFSAWDQGVPRWRFCVFKRRLPYKQSRFKQTAPAPASITVATTLAVFPISICCVLSALHSTVYIGPHWCFESLIYTHALKHTHT